MEDILAFKSIFSHASILQHILTLYGPNSFFRRFSGHNLR